MSRLEDFLSLPNVADEVAEVYVSKRLGTFKVKPMTIDQHKEYQDRCKGNFTKNGMKFDNTKFNLLIVENQVIDPNFKDADFLNRANFSNPRDFIKAKLKPGEVLEIAQKICEISGFEVDPNEEIEKAKNS